MVVAEASSSRCQCGAVALVETDDELVGDEAVHLGDVLAISRHAKSDDMDEVVVVVDAGPFAETVRRLHRHRMEVERVRQHRRYVVVGPRVVEVEVEPEEPASGDRLVDAALGRVSGLAVFGECPLHRTMFSLSQGPAASLPSSSGPFAAACASPVASTAAISSGLAPRRRSTSASLSLITANCSPRSLWFLLICSL